MAIPMLFEYSTTQFYSSSFLHRAIFFFTPSSNLLCFLTPTTSNVAAAAKPFHNLEDNHPFLYIFFFPKLKDVCCVHFEESGGTYPKNQRFWREYP